MIFTTIISIYMNYQKEQDFLWESMEFFNEQSGSEIFSIDSKFTALPNKIEILERTSIEDALIVYEGNRSKAAKHLGIGRTNLIAKIKKYKL